MVEPVASVVEGKRQRAKQIAETWVFPEDLSSHFMHFNLMEMKTESAGTTLRQGRGGIALPIPGQLIDNLQLNWQDAETGALGGLIADTLANTPSDDVIGTFLEAGKKYVSGSYEFGKDVSKIGLTGALEAAEKEADISTAITAKFRGGTGAMAFGLNRFFGKVPNPNLTAMFRGVALKTHNLSWKLVPASQDEHRILETIIRKFKVAALPERTGKFSLGYPYEVDISIAGTVDRTGDITAEYFHFPFKAAVIRNVSVNYTPDGGPSFYGGTGAPTAVQLTLDLQETSIHTRKDIDKTRYYVDQATGTYGNAK